VISALLILDGAVQVAGRARGWTRPVAWLAPAFTVASSFLFLFVLLPGFGRDGDATAARYRALEVALEAVGEKLGPDHSPVISDFPIWLAEDARVRTLGLPDEPPENVLELAKAAGFDATLLVVQADNGGQWPEVVDSDLPGADCFRLLDFGTTLNPTASQAVTQALTPAAASPARTRPPPAAGLAFPHLADVSAEPAVFRAAGRATDPATPSPARTR